MLLPMPLIFNHFTASVVNQASCKNNFHCSWEQFLLLFNSTCNDLLFKNFWWHRFQTNITTTDEHVLKITTTDEHVFKKLLLMNMFSKNCWWTCVQKLMNICEKKLLMNIIQWFCYWWSKMVKNKKHQKMQLQLPSF